MKLRRFIAIFSLVAVTAASIYGYMIYKDIFSVNTAFPERQVAVYIPTEATYAEVEEIVAPYIEDMERFRMVAEKKSYVGNVRAGKFILKNGMNSNDIINSLRVPVPVKLSFNNQETLEKTIGRIAEQIEPDSIALYNAFTDKTFMEDNGFNKDNILSIFIPNTYEFFWDASTNKVREKMAWEYRRFWNEERKAKAEALGLTPLEVSSLAAIVHKETVKADERPRVEMITTNGELVRFLI